MKSISVGEQKFFSIVDNFARDIKTKKVFVERDALVVFLCGARPNSDNPTRRDKFYAYAKRHLTDYFFLMAEDFFNNFKGEMKNLLSIEQKIASYSDCIMIILESPSTFCELGAFSIINELSKILLPVNDVAHKDDESFINLGPIAKVNVESGFSPVVLANYNHFSSCFSDIVKRLAKLKSIRRTRIYLNSYAHYLDYLGKQKMFLLYEIVAMFSPVTFNDISYIYNVLFGRIVPDLHYELSLLQTIEYITCYDKYYVPKRNDIKFIEFEGFNIPRFRASLISLYNRYFIDRLSYLWI